MTKHSKAYEGHLGRIEEVHLLPFDRVQVYESGKESVLSLCENYKFVSTKGSGKPARITYLTTREFLLKDASAEADTGYDVLTQDEYVYYESKLCEECRTHKDLPLIALKELT